MKISLLLLGASLCVASVAAATSGKHHAKDSDVHIHVRLIKSQPTHGKFTVLEIGKQCAYDPAKDPSMYPCRNGGVCVRTSPTFGKCFTKEEAEKLTREDGAAPKAKESRRRHKKAVDGGPMTGGNGKPRDGGPMAGGSGRPHKKAVDGGPMTGGNNKPLDGGPMTGGNNKPHDGGPMTGGHGRPHKHLRAQDGGPMTGGAGKPSDTEEEEDYEDVEDDETDEYYYDDEVYDNVEGDDDSDSSV